MLGQFKDLYKLQKQAKEIKKKLKNTHIEAEHEGISVIVSGEQELVEIKISEEARNNKNLEENLLKCVNKGMKKAQEVAAGMMKDVMGGFPGLGGGDAS